MKKKILAIAEKIFNRFPGLLYFFDNSLFYRFFFHPFLLYRPHLFERYFSKKPTFFAAKHILLIKTDAIGDYVIFRRCLLEFLNYYENNGYKCTLVGNELWKDLAEHDFRGRALEMFFLNKNNFENQADAHYRVKKLLDVNQRVYHTVIYWSFSRSTLCGDWIAKHIASVNKIGVNGDLQCQNADQKAVGNGIYTRLLQPPVDLHFEPYRNQWLCKQLIDRTIPTYIPYHLQNQTNTAVIMPGASASFRQWPPEFFAEVCGYLAVKYACQIVVVGSNVDFQLGEKIKELAGCGELENLCGKTDLPTLQDIIQKARILISNESAGIHFAAELGTRAVCISNGNHYGRFNPYELYGYGFIKTVYPPEVERLSHNLRLEKFFEGSTLDIAEVNVSAVIKAVDDLMMRS